MSGRLQRWEIVLIALAILKVILAVALVGFTLGTQSERIEPRHALLFAHVAVFGAAATMLLWGGRRDARAALLGSTFMLTAAVFGDNALALSPSLPGSVTAAIRVVFAIQVDAFTAYFLWRFVSAFPGVDRIGARYALPRLACQVALLVGVALFAINLLYAFGRLNESWPALYDALTPLARKSSRQATWYWITQYALTLPALPALAWEARGMTAHERRRVSLLIAGLVVGLAPTILWVLATSISPQIGRGFKYAAWVIYPALLSTPLTTAYAVIVQEALDTRLVVRRAVQYALARYTLVAAAAIPALLLAMGIYQVRDRSVKELATLSNSALVLVLILATTVVGRRRRGAIEALDRRFFREQYDARRILGDLVERCRNATGRSELAEVMSGEIDRALHLSSVSVLFRDRSGGSLTSTRLGVRPLETSSKIVRHLSESNAALDVDVERPTAFIAGLPDSDLHWLTDTGTRLLVPLKDKEGQLTGLMTLGEKKSELPFSQEDRLLLNAVASAAALTLAYLGVQSHDTDGQPAAVVAEGGGGAECVACGLLDDSTAQRCGRCGSELNQSLIPRLLGNKFRVIERVGVGGMGVVYRALDIELGRQVALKTLPRVAPSRAARLRREARTIAALSHANLALIYGTESWNGIPILVLEFLGGGTLATRIASGRMNVSEALEIGMTLADVVGTLHRAGIVHRDIKPSNIGFTTDGTLKLLDFGVARLLSEPLQHAGSDGRPPWRPPPNVPDGSEGSATATTADQQVVGTPLYLSPEALAGREPEPSFDIWGICVVLYEAIAGTHPARDTSLNKSLLRIESAAFPDIRSFTPSANAALAEFFRRALSVHAAERPRSARALREDLGRLAASGYSPIQAASVA